MVKEEKKEIEREGKRERDHNNISKNASFMKNIMGTLKWAVSPMCMWDSLFLTEFTQFNKVVVKIQK